jgi:hypothetical protein
MDLPSVFEWFAQETINLAERANEPKKRERLLALAVLWVTAARQCRSEAPARNLPQHRADRSLILARSPARLFVRVPSAVRNQ